MSYVLISVRRLQTIYCTARLSHHVVRQDAGAPLSAVMFLSLHLTMQCLLSFSEINAAETHVIIPKSGKFVK